MALWGLTDNLRMQLSEASYYCHQVHWAGTRSVARYRSIMDWWVDVLGDPCLDPLSSGLGPKIREVILEHDSSSTRRKYLAVLARVLRHAALHLGMPQEALVSQLGLPKYRQAPGRKTALTEAQATELVSKITCPRSKALTEFLLDTGARVSEALAVTSGPLTGELHWVNHVTFTNTKSSQDRRVPLTFRAQMARGRGWRRLTYTTYRRRLAEAAATMDVAVTPHILRHTCITRLVMAGVPLPVVQGIAGHGSIETTMKYTHPDISDYRAAIDKLG